MLKFILRKNFSVSQYEATTIRHVSSRRVFLCTGVVSLKLAQPLIERKNVKLQSFVGQSSTYLGYLVQK